MENFSFSEIDLAKKSETVNLSGQESIAFSNKLVAFFKVKAKSYNEGNKKKVTHSQISDVFCSAVDSFAEREDLSKTINEWCFARINGFLRIINEKSVNFLSKKSSAKKEIDATKNWQPSQEDFLMAKKDIEENGLSYAFASLEELYIKEAATKYWFDV